MYIRTSNRLSDMAVCFWKGIYYLTVIPDVNKAFNIR
jgi:hypothetical protein